jgi:thiol:disulfide interchange protein DsbD
LLFFVLGVGMGLPYVVLAVAANRLGRLPKAGAWLVWSKKLLGVVLLGLALYFVQPILPQFFLKTAVVGLLLGAGIYLGWLDRTRGSGRGFLFVRRVVGAGLILAAAAVAWPTAPRGPSVAWMPYSEALLEQARRDRKPVLIDIYADWCLPCVELDHVTFSHPSVVQALEPVVTLRVDATSDVSSDDERLLERHNVFGVPTVLLFDPDGRERTDLRVTGFLEPREFLKRLEKILVPS